MATIHDLRRRPVPARAGPPPVKAFVAVAVLLGGLAIAYFAGAFGHRFAPANTLDGVYDRYVDAIDRLADEMKPLKSAADVPAHAAAVGPKLDAIADQIDGLTAQLDRLPHFTLADVNRVASAHRAAERKAMDRLTATVDPLKGSVDLNSPLFGPLLVRVPAGFMNFHSTLERLATAAPTGPPGVPAPPAGGFAASPPPPPLPSPVSGGPPPSPAGSAAEADGQMTVHVHGLSDRDRQGPVVQEHYRHRCSAFKADGGPDPADPTGYVMTLWPIRDVPMAAGRVDFGYARVDADGRSITVVADARAAYIRPDGPPARPAGLADRFPADQVVTVRIHGLADRGSDGLPLYHHLRGRLGAVSAQPSDDTDDLNGYIVVLAPAPDVAAIAAAVDFGSTVVDGRTVVVNADAAKVAAALGPATPPPAVTPVLPLPDVIPVGTPLQVRRGPSWYPATVLRREGRRYRVHYADQPDATDEWVGKDRLRPTGAM